MPMTFENLFIILQKFWLKTDKVGTTYMAIN